MIRTQYATLEKMIIHNAASHAQFNPGKMGKVSLVAGTYLYAGLNCLEPGQEHHSHVHPDQDKMYLVLEGQAVATLAGEVHELSPGGLLLAPAGVAHGLRNPGPARLVVLVTFGPPPSKS